MFSLSALSGCCKFMVRRHEFDEVSSWHQLLYGRGVPPRALLASGGHQKQRNHGDIWRCWYRVWNLCINKIQNSQFKVALKHCAATLSSKCVEHMNIRSGYWIVLSFPPKFKTYCTQRFDIMSLFDLTRVTVSNLISSWNGSDFLKICPDSNCVKSDDDFWTCAFCELCGNIESLLTLNVAHWIMLFVANRCENRAIWFRCSYLISQKASLKLFLKQPIPA